MKNKTNTMKSISCGAALVGALLLGGCAKIYTITDSVTLYPENAPAQKWGMLRFYSQYQSDMLPSDISVSLPNGDALSGQLIYIADSGVTESDDDGWFNNVNVGIGVGHHFHHSGWGFGMSTPVRNTYYSDKQQVSINAYSKALSMNCQGEFNRRQKTGTVSCQLTNGMHYTGTLRRVVSQ